MTIIEFANARKWHEWFPYAIWLTVSGMALMKGDYANFVLFLILPAAAFVSSYWITKWRTAAFNGLEVIAEQRLLIMDVVTAIQDEDVRLEVCRRHQEILSKLKR